MVENKKYIYLDSAASASSSDFNVVDDYANPNSIHDAGRDSYRVLEEAREYIASAIGAKRPSEIIFSSGATESNNMAIFGIARATKGKIKVCAIEHESALEPALELQREGYDVEIMPVDKNGMLIDDDLDGKTSLVIVQHSNTEIGTIQDIKKICEKAHKVGAYVHSDMVGSFGRLPINVQELGVDSASFSGHKIGAPKGIGFLYIKSKTPIKPLFYGGGQERGLRAGTQNVALVCSMTKALEFYMNCMEQENKKYLDFKNEILSSLVPGVRTTIDNKFALPNILHLVFKNKESENLILYYGKHGISVSGGPACSDENKKASHVLNAIGVPEDEIFGAMRLSFGIDTGKEDIEKFIQTTKELMK